MAAASNLKVSAKSKYINSNQLLLPSGSEFDYYNLTVQIRSFSGPYFPVFSPNTGKYAPEITPYLDTFHAVSVFIIMIQ